jgi:ribosomal protein L40E
MTPDEATRNVDPAEVLSMQHCRRCGAHVGVRADGAAATACNCLEGPDLEGPDPGCDWP